jgi:hypothetical protein
LAADCTNLFCFLFSQLCIILCRVPAVEGDAGFG